MGDDVIFAPNVPNQFFHREDAEEPEVSHNSADISQTSLPSVDAPILVTTRLKLEIPVPFDNEYDGWFRQVVDAQEEILKTCLTEFEIAYDKGYEENADEADTACQQKFHIFSYMISSSKFSGILLRFTRKFFEEIKAKDFPPFMTPLLIFPTSDCFSPDIVTHHGDVSMGALLYGNIQGGMYFNHWEISMDQFKPLPQRGSDKIFVNFEYDKVEMISAKFSYHKKGLKIDTKLTISKKHIRRIIVDNAVHDQFGSGRTRINFELTYPPTITERNSGGGKKGADGQGHYDRQTTIRCGRRENEWPKDADLSDSPFFTLEFSQKIENAKIFSILSRLRIKTSLAIEFGAFPIIDAIVKAPRPYFMWMNRDRQPKDVIGPTSKKCEYYQSFLKFCFPLDLADDEDIQEESDRRRFVITFLIECLLSRGAIVKDQLCLHQDHWERFIKIVAMQVKDNFGRAERSLERLVTMIDERKRIGSINNTLIMIFAAITAEDTNPITMQISDSEQREGYQKIICTTTRTIYTVPEMMMSNRVLRKFDPYGTNVLRVTFRDDNGQKMRSSTTADKNIERVVQTKLEHGTTVAGREFGYLGSSNSQMRDHGAYFMQKMSDRDRLDFHREHGFDVEPDAARLNEMPQIISVRKQLGKFEKIESIPKLMARLGQCFTQSKQSGVVLPLNRCAYTYDVIGGQNSMGVEFTFTDGVGLISQKFAQEIAKDFGVPFGSKPPSCYQFRYRGMKGVLAVDKYLDQHNEWAKKYARDLSPPEPICNSWTVDIALRPSQEKFYGARQENIEVVKISSPSPVSLNRPFINILDQVSLLQGYHVHKRIVDRIEQLLDRQMRGFATQMIDEITCRNKLKEMPRRIDIDKLSTSAGFEMSNEVFFRSLIKSSVKFSISKQLSKAQIQIPFECGRTLLGIADETGRLQYGQVYCQVTKSMRDKFPPENAAKTVLKGTVLLTKNPCIVAGDVRIFEAIDIPDLHHLVDVIVFPRHGPRPHPDEMAGSDLDGDEYCVIWDKQLLLARNELPFDFAVPKRVDSEIGDQVQKKMAEFYINYMTQDAVGTIANAFLTASDLFGINHNVCMSLAKKNSEAVDFTKSGRPPDPLTKDWRKDEATGEEIPPERSERQPDFMASDMNRAMYESPRLLGTLHREIRKIEDVLKIAEDKDDQIPIELDPYLVIDGWKEYEKVADEALARYNTQLRTMMETYGIRSEAEIFSGCICDIRTRLSDKDQDDMSFFNTNQMIETKVTSYFRRYREEFFEVFGGWKSCTEKVDKPFADEENICHRECKNPTIQMQKKAVAYYICCYRRAQKSDERKLSFAWLPYDVLSHVKQEKTRTEPYTITGNPLFKLLEDHMTKYLAERQRRFYKFCQFEQTATLCAAIEPLRKYCHKYDGLDRLLFIVHEWGRNRRLYSYRFSSTHLSMLVIMYFTNAFASLDGDALQILEPIPLNLTVDDLERELFGAQPRLLLKFLEFLSSRKFGRLTNINFRPLGVQSVFCRGEWVPFHEAALTTYHNMVYNLRFEDLPLKKEKLCVKKEIIRECDTFTIELPEGLPVGDAEICNKMKEKSGAEEVQLRRMQNNKVLVSARGTLESLDRLKKIATVRPPLSTGARGKEVIQQLFKLVYEKIMKDEVPEERDVIGYSDSEDSD